MTVVPYIVANDARAHTVGGTASATLRLSPRWRLRASYTYLDESARLEDGAPPGSIVDANPGLNPAHQAALWTSVDLPQNLELDILGRYASRLEVDPAVSKYLQADVQLGMRIGEQLRVALIGRDLLSPRHVEFPRGSLGPRAIERQVRARASWTF
jgi:outer membrane receptor protein involved in Fe transport